MNMTTRHSALYALLVGGLFLATLGGCSAGNPNLSSAQDAYEQNNYDQALSSVETAIDQDSANSEAYMLKASILRSMADSTTPPEEYDRLYQRAREAEEMAVKFNPGVRSQMNQRRRLSYVQQMQAGADYFNRGNQSGDSTEFVRAATYFDAANTIYPDSASAHLNEAYARLRAGQRSEAIPALQKHVDAADSVSSDAFEILGQLYLADDQSQQAIGILETAAEQYPEDSEINSLLLNAYNRAGEQERAMKAYSEQVEQNPENATYRYNYGSLLLNADRFDEAIEQLQRAVDLDPDNVQAQYNLGAAYVNKAASANDSIRVMQDSIGDEDPSSEEQQQLKQLAQQRRQAFQDAIAPLERARQLAGSDSQYRTDICSALFQAYVQTEQQEKAAQVEECAGYEDNNARQEASGEGSGDR